MSWTFDRDVAEREAERNELLQSRLTQAQEVAPAHMPRLTSRALAAARPRGTGPPRAPSSISAKGVSQGMV